MGGKRFRMFAGPNGSGKTTLIKEISRTFNIGYFINADRIEASLNLRKYVDCSDFSPRPIFDEEWVIFLSKYKKDSRFADGDLRSIEVKENRLVCSQTVNSYQAAVIAEFFRENLLLVNQTFSFETVMSHESKVNFLRKAKQHGFATYLYFICTRDPWINAIPRPKAKAGV